MIFTHMKEQFNHLIDLIQKLDSEQITTKVHLLGQASIGQHTRHIIELWQCALSAYNTGLVDYHNRQRNLLLETDKELMLETLDRILSEAVRDDRELRLFAAGDIHNNPETVSSTYHREVVYNVEHMIHHMALIKVALRCMELELTSPDFGMAYATLEYRSQ